MFLSFIHTVACISTQNSFFLLLNSTLLRDCTPLCLSTHLPTDWYSPVVLNHSAINNSVHVSMQTCVFTFTIQIPKNGTAGLHAKLMISLLKKLAVFPKWLEIYKVEYHFILQTVFEGSRFSPFMPTLDTVF